MANQRDYYADLELPRDADVSDIKKQFRKLALKYHPDRNPGREQDVNAKFQIIQAAHEVLSNPSEKAKHDAILGRARSYGASGVRGNPWANAGNQFPTPPRRTNAAQSAARNTPNNHKNAQSGAQRWQSRFSSGVPPTAKQKYGSDPEAKKNAAKAFENMRKNAQKEPRSTEPPPPPPRNPPGTESARQRAEASFGARKSGYYPRSTMPGDEPPVPNHNYSRFDRREVPPPPPERPGSYPMPDPLSQFRERNDVNNSTKPHPESSSGGRQHRSANEGTAHNAESNAGHMNADGPPTTTKPTPTPRYGKFSATDKPSNSEDGAEPSMYAKFHGQVMFTWKNFYNLQSSPLEFGPKHKTPAIKLESSRLFGQDPCPSGVSRDSVASIIFEQNQTSVLNGLIDYKNQHPWLYRTIALGVSSMTDNNKSRHESLTNKGKPYSFSFPYGDDTLKETKTRPDITGFAKSSIDDINTKFVNGEGSNAWRFSAGTAENGEANVGDRLSPYTRKIRQPHLRKRPTMRRNENSTNTASQAPKASQSSQAAQTESKFNAEGWSDKFGPQTFVPQSAPGPCVSPTRTTRANSKKSKAKPPTAENAASVEDHSSDEEKYDWRGRSAEAQARAAAAASYSPQAMDIDTPPSESSQTQAARNIHVEPSRPEWRAGNVDGTSEPAVIPQIPRIPQRPAKIPLHANDVGSEDTEEFRATLAALKNMTPFSQPKQGLDSLNGLKDHLPPVGKAPDVPPVRLPIPQSLDFPQPPGAPRVPTMIRGGIKPDALLWNKYVADFEQYLRQWDTFNAQVVQHLSARKEMISGARSTRGYAFLTSRDDTEIQEYFNWVQLDNDVRRRWMNACTEHEGRMREFMLFRDELKRSS
ncbi:hypothetical protein E4U15_002341 [Claviceps sp. LM218 group G6]|nr:hypothetical protein E4U15_002341 [Claviceps sp. LM218 group G6]